MIPLPPFKKNIFESSLVLEAIIRAGKEVMKIYDTDFTSSLKSDNSPITKADLVSNNIIKQVLQKTGYHILTEEEIDNSDRLKEKILWIVDPLDGTSDFIDKTGEFTIMIALVKNKYPVLGAINWPFGNTIYLAQQGEGAFKFKDKWQKISTSTISNLKEARCVVSRHHVSKKENKLLERLGIKKFSNVGSSLKVAKISEGEADVYFTFTDKMKEWDSCASNCILSEAGGIMTDMKGKSLTYNNESVSHKNGILAANKILHKRVLEVINQNW